MADDAALPFRFVVETTFRVTGRGTFAAGLIERGSVRRGDVLRVEGTGLTLRCTAVEYPRDADGRPVVALGAWPDLPPEDVAPGSVLVRA